MVKLASPAGVTAGPTPQAAETLAREVDGLPELPSGSWAVLDCDFGVPLFSTLVNEQVCQAISKHHLWEPDRYVANYRELIIFPCPSAFLQPCATIFIGCKVLMPVCWADLRRRYFLYLGNLY